MPRRAFYSDTLPALVRRYFGLQQVELADFLGVSPELVKHIEAGRRTLSPVVLARLWPLARLVPAELPPAAPDSPPDPAGRPADGPLLARLDYCQYHAARLRRAMRPLLARADYARRWHEVLPTLLAEAPAADLSAPNPEGRARRAREWLAGQPTALSPDELAHYHLLRLQAEALEAEAAGLAALLAPGPPG
jgi:DNA-binding XRE family transcriptional regulator